MRRSVLSPFPFLVTIAALGALCLAGLSGPGVSPARAGDPAPTHEDVASWILQGDDAAHERVASWLGKAAREDLLGALAQARARHEKAAGLLGPTVPDGDLVNLETWVLRVGSEEIENLLAGRDPSQSAASVEAAQAQSLLERLEAGERIQHVSGSRITVYDGQRATVSSTKSCAFIQDYDVTVEDGVRIADPIVGTVVEGISLDLLPAVASDGASLLLTVWCDASSLARPIAQREIPLGAGEPVWIQLPETTLARTRSTLRLPDGGWALLVPGPSGEGEEAEARRAVVLIRASVLPAGSDPDSRAR